MLINKKSYVMPEMNFNSLCILESLGASFDELGKKSFSTIRAFLALAMGGDLEKAGNELEAHLVSGGTLDELLAEIVDAMTKSDFFQRLKA